MQWNRDMKVAVGDFESVNQPYCFFFLTVKFEEFAFALSSLSTIALFFLFNLAARNLN